MQPNIPLPTDNIHKFACLFGLVLIVSCIFSFVSLYSSSLDRKVKYSEVILALKAKDQLTKAEQGTLEMNQQLIKVTKSNEDFAGWALAVFLVTGIALSISGAKKWHDVQQRRDDQVSELQLRKLTAEVAKLEAEVKGSSQASFNEDEAG